MTAIKRTSWILAFNLHRYASPNVDVLRDSGVPEASITFLLAIQPATFVTTCDKFKELIEEVKRMGFDSLRLKFVKAIFVLKSMSKSTWDRKGEVYKSWGWYIGKRLSKLL
ncbi:hypothetical protein L1049_017416 [Liquidambar formosana]|uniref:Uncharacterized protein n=1 Tax=Liquidambar formosana TaxID=63359 RepID=A0AAP0S153_LIQFO